MVERCLRKQRSSVVAQLCFPVAARSTISRLRSFGARLVKEDQSDLSRQEDESSAHLLSPVDVQLVEETRWVLSSRSLRV